MRAPQLIFGLLGVAWCACSDSGPAHKDGPPPGNDVGVVDVPPVADTAHPGDTTRPGDTRPKGDQKPISREGGGSDKAGATATAYDINQKIIKDGASVTLSDLIVTAVGGTSATDVWAQDPKGGKYSGLLFYKPARTDGAVADLKPGDHITATGKVTWFTPASSPYPNGKKTIEIMSGSLTRLSGGTPPAPAVISPADAVTDDANQIGPWTSVLVVLQNLSAGCFNAQYSELALTPGLSLAPELFSFTAPAFGTCLTFTGVLAYFYDYYIYPRSAADLAAGSGCSTVKTVGIKADVRNGASANHPAPGSQVTISGAVVTAVATYPSSTGKYTGFWVEETSGGTRSGLYVFYTWSATTPAAAQPSVGDLIDVSGTYLEYKAASSSSPNTLAELSDACFTKKGTASVPAPLVIADPSTIATGGSAVKDYEGVLVRVNNVTVGDPILTTGTSPKVVGFKLDPSALWVDNLIFDFVAGNPPPKGSTYTSITGVLHYLADNYMILPRSAADLQK